MQFLDNRKTLYYFFWDTTYLIEFDLKSSDINQKEVLFECKIPRFSKVIVCPNSSNVNPNQSLNNSSMSISLVNNESCRIFIQGGYLNEPGTNSIKALGWNLEYVREPCFIQPKAQMKVARYHQCCLYDDKRNRIYVFSGVGEDASAV
jgi:hypothetical protein